MANTTEAIVQLGFLAGEALENRTLLKREVKNILIGNETTYPEASIQYNKYLKSKKNSIGFLLSGVAVTLGGFALNQFAHNKLFGNPDFDTYEAYETKIKIGNGFMYSDCFTVEFLYICKEVGGPWNIPG